MYKIKGLDFVQTCSGCPEQYDVFHNGEQVCYIRLRWGSLYAECPDVGGEIIYEADIGTAFSGTFESHDQRQYHLMKIAKAIHMWLEKRDNSAEDDDDEDCDLLYLIEFEVDNGAYYDKDVALVWASTPEEANEKLKRMVGSIDSETCVSRIFKTVVFYGSVFTGRHGWKE